MLMSVPCTCMSVGSTEVWSWLNQEEAKELAELLQGQDSWEVSWMYDPVELSGLVEGR